MTGRYDVAITGGGPAGLTAATLLARAGARVAVVARPPRGRRRPGETLPGAGQRLLRALSLPELAGGGTHRPLSGISSAWQSTDLVETDHLASPDGASWLIDRDAFDAALAEAAAEAGVRMLAAGKAPERAVGRWMIDDKQEVVEADFMVDATGRSARIARRAAPEPEADGSGIALWSIAVGDAPPRLQRPMIERTAEGWWFAIRLNPSETYVAFHTQERLQPAGRRANEWHRLLRQTRWLAPQLERAGTFGPVRGCPASGTRLRQPFGNGWAACGDAAMALDPLSSQGILNAMAGGHELAKALSSADGRNKALEHYADRLNETWCIYSARRAALLGSATAQ